MLGLRHQPTLGGIGIGLMTSPSGKDPHTDRDWAQEYLDVAGVILIVLNADGTVRLINRKGREVLERPEAEIVGRDWFNEFLPERLRKDVRHVFDQLMQGAAEAPEYFENPVLSKDGTEKLIAWHNTVLRDEQGRIQGTLSSGEDITSRHASQAVLASREAQLRAIFDTAVDGIITIDSQGGIQSFNPAASRLFGYEESEVVGQNISLLMPEPDRSRHNRYIDNYLRTGEAQIIGIGREVFGLRKDGTRFPLYLAVSETKVEDRVLFTGIVHDLTEFKELQQQVLHSRNLAALGEMAATVAHEIKNPLAGISGAIQVLRDTLDHADSRRGIMDEVLEQVRRMDKTVRQLLMLAKPWWPSKEPSDLAALSQEIARSAADRTEFAHVKLRVAPSPPVNAKVDPSLFEQVLWNVLSNAAQAAEGGEIRVRFDDGAEESMVIVEDEGPGIAPQIRERLFQPFATTRTSGAGLGLAICKKIMDSHGGSIRVASDVAKGARVILAFPK